MELTASTEAATFLSDALVLFAHLIPISEELFRNGQSNKEFQKEVENGLQVTAKNLETFIKWIL
jgi:hypothetical protein